MQISVKNHVENEKEERKNTNLVIGRKNHILQLTEIFTRLWLLYSILSVYE